MIVKARSIPYGVGPYQLIICGRLAVPRCGKTGPALYVSFLLPRLHRTCILTFGYQCQCACGYCMAAPCCLIALNPPFMRMRIRVLMVWLNALLRLKSVSTSKQSVLSFRVMPWDCVIRYMGNDRYLCFMDLGRMDLAYRLGWVNILRKKNLQPQVVGCFARYYRPLRCFDHFVLRTYLVHTNGVSVWLAHYFEKNGVIYCSAISKLVAISGSQIFHLESLQVGEHLLRKQSYQMNKNMDQLFNQGNALLKKLSSDPF